MFQARYSRGVTFIEFILALAASTFLITMIFSIYLSASYHHRQQESLVALYDNAQLISDILKKQIHMAGYTGNTKVLKNKITLYSSPEIKKNSDALTIWHFDTHDSYFVGNTGRFNQKHQPIYAFYMRENDQEKIELAEGIEDMKIEYQMSEGEIKGISFQLKLVSISDPALQKIWYVDAAV